MKTIFLTGASGFLGSYVLENLLEESQVIVLLRPSSNPWRISHLIHHKNLSIIEGSLDQESFLNHIFETTKIDTVCHLAWQGVENEFRNDSLQVTANLYPSINLIEISSKHSVQQWIGLGSQAEYGPHSGVIDEHIVTRPSTLYGAVKLSLMTVGEQISRMGGMSFCWLRLFSSYGPKDNMSWMYCYVIQALLKGKVPQLTEGKQMWDYIYVKDAAKAISTIALRGNISGTYNLGSGDSYTVRSIVEMIRDMIDPSLALNFGAIPYRDDQVMFLQADISKLSQSIQWLPETTLKDGFYETINWHKTII